jgi:hypothetical protein
MPQAERAEQGEDEAARERDRLIRALEEQEEGTPAERMEAAANTEKLLRPKGFFARVFKATTYTG